MGSGPRTCDREQLVSSSLSSSSTRVMISVTSTSGTNRVSSSGCSHFTMKRRNISGLYASRDVRGAAQFNIIVTKEELTYLVGVQIQVAVMSLTCPGLGASSLGWGPLSSASLIASLDGAQRRASDETKLEFCDGSQTAMHDTPSRPLSNSAPFDFGIMFRHQHLRQHWLSCVDSGCLCRPIRDTGYYPERMLCLWFEMGDCSNHHGDHTHPDRPVSLSAVEGQFRLHSEDGTDRFQVLLRVGETFRLIG